MKTIHSRLFDTEPSSERSGKILQLVNHPIRSRQHIRRNREADLLGDLVVLTKPNPIVSRWSLHQLLLHFKSVHDTPNSW
jgi:hypothetical protein